MDSRRGKNTQFALADLLRQSVCSRSAGYEDVNDAERLAHDPTFRLIGPEKIWDRVAALALGIGEPPTGSDFSDDVGRERKSVGRISRKRTRFGPQEQEKGQP